MNRDGYPHDYGHFKTYFWNGIPCSDREFAKHLEEECGGVIYTGGASVKRITVVGGELVEEQI